MVAQGQAARRLARAGIFSLFETSSESWVTVIFSDDDKRGLPVGLRKIKIRCDVTEVCYMLMLRLEAGEGSWLTAFTPIYLGMLSQLVLHYRKQPDSRGRRPGVDECDARAIASEASGAREVGDHLSTHKKLQTIIL